jgi:hypothetical protein
MSLTTEPLLTSSPTAAGGPTAAPGSPARHGGFQWGTFGPAQPPSRVPALPQG